MRYGSTFTGIDGIAQGVHAAFPDAECVFWAENNKHAITTYLKHFPENEGKNLGDLEAYYDNEEAIAAMPYVDFFFGGPPCQGLSIANSGRLDLDDPRSRLFYVFRDYVKIKKPKWFLMENVATMKNSVRDHISEQLGVDYVTICSDRFTPQKRWRYYWFNWDFDINLLPKEGDRWPNLIAWSSSNDYDKVTGEWLRRRDRDTIDGRANTLTTGANCGSYSSMNYIALEDGTRRKINIEEAERLQGLPRGYTEGVSLTQRYRQVGNSVTPQVIEFIMQQHPWSKK